MREDSQMKHDVIPGTTAGTPQNNLPNQGIGDTGTKATGAGKSGPVKMTQTSDGIGGSTSHLGKG